MSHIVNYDGQYFRIEIASVSSQDNSDEFEYVGWCSDAFVDLQDMPQQALAQFIDGPPLPTAAAALQYAYEWIENHWDRQQARWLAKPGDLAGTNYFVGLFKGDSATQFDFKRLAEARAFADAAQKSISLTKVGIRKNNEPQYLSTWAGTQRAAGTSKVGDTLSVVYTTWLFVDDVATGCDFEDYTDASALAKAAEKCHAVTKAGVKNNESPQFLSVWKRD